MLPIDKNIVRVQPRSFSNDIDVAIFREVGDGRLVVMHTVKEEVLETGLRVDPTTTISKSMAQQLMDDLYRCGIRPTDSLGTQGEKDALKDHLKSMKEVYEKQAGTNQQLLDYVIGKKQS